MNRRCFSLLAAALLAVPALSLAQMAPQTQPQDQPPLPYKTVIAKPEDSKKVFIFVSFTCGVCAEYDDQLIRWAHTLPKDWDVEFVPAVLPKDRDSVIAARAFYAVKSIDRGYLDVWMPEVYAALQTRGEPASDSKTWEKIASTMMMPGFNAAWKDEKSSGVKDAYQKLMAYGVDATPTIAIGGKYLITPDNTNGNQDLFFQLANGLVSKSMSN